MTQETTPDLAAGIAWLRELAGTCKAEAQQWFDRSCEDEGQEWRVRGESYAFIADQIERGHSPFTALTNPTDCCAKTREACANLIQKRMDDRFAEYGTREGDTNACYYQGAGADIFEALDEEAEEVITAIRKGADT